MTTDSEKKKFTQVYQLEFTINDKIHPFYVGFSSDPQRREREHRAHPYNVNAVDYHNYKYQLIRELDKNGIEWRMTILSPMVEDDEDSEYAWVIRVARNNRFDGIKYYNNLPLTNMKMGDMLEEMLAERELNTAQQIREWRQVRELRKAVEYEARQFVAPQNDAFGRVMNRLGGTSTIKRGAREWDLPKPMKKVKKR